MPHNLLVYAVTPQCGIPTTVGNKAGGLLLYFLLTLLGLLLFLVLGVEPEDGITRQVLHFRATGPSLYFCNLCFSSFLFLSKDIGTNRYRKLKQS